MGWWPSFLGGSQSTDPLENLDPKLREFLEKESPVKYPPKSAPARQPGAPTKDRIPEANQQPTVPSQSLYQDGRYAHLWKNYVPQAQVEAETASDHDKLLNVLEGYKERKQEISKVAMENCAEEQEEWINCMKHGKWEDQLQMCRHQVRRFERCFTMQSRFLRALGYGSVYGRSREVEDDIQMHADALYQRMLQHEKAVENAKKDGTPIPVFDPVVPRGQAVVQPSEEVEKNWRELLDKLPEDERAAEEAALRADLQAKSDMAKAVRELRGPKKNTGSEGQSAEGKSPPSFGETIAALLGGGKGSS